jgi:hypothetical protein
MGEFDLRVMMIWKQGGREFTTWFLPVVLLSNFLYLRGSTRLPFLRALIADLALAAVLPVSVPLSLLVWALLHQLIPDLGAPDSATLVGLSFGVLISALISTAFQSARLGLFKQRVALQGFWFLVLLNVFCLTLAIIRTMIALRFTMA